MNIQIIGNGNISSNNFNSSFLINDSILVDTPPGVLKKIKSLDKKINDIKIIIITHLHGDHYFDLPFIILNEYIRRREDELIIIGPKALKRKIEKLTMLAFNSRLNKYTANLNISFIDAFSIQNNEIGEGIYLSSIKMTHGDLKDCFGYLFSKNDKTLAITGDTEMCPGLTYMLKKANAVLIDVNDKKGKHLSLKELEKLSNEYNLSFIPCHYPDEIQKDLAKIKNIKIMKPGEQFYI